MLVTSEVNYALMIHVHETRGSFQSFSIGCGGRDHSQYRVAEVASHKHQYADQLLAQIDIENLTELAQLA
jgi:hypothetical protein